MWLGGMGIPCLPLTGAAPLHLGAGLNQRATRGRRGNIKMGSSGAGLSAPHFPHTSGQLCFLFYYLVSHIRPHFKKRALLLQREKKLVKNH